MTETTTIQITKPQRKALEDINDASAKAAVRDLLEAYEGDDSTKTEHNINEVLDAKKADVPSSEEIAGAVVADLRAELPGAVADEVEARLR